MRFALLSLACALATPAAALEPFPHDFRAEDIQTDGATIHVRVGGHGPAVLMLHGFGDTGDMWAPLAARLEADHTVIVPDLRGMGLSSHPAGGYDKKSEAEDMARVLDTLHITQVDLVTHDIGNMVGFAFAELHPNRVTRFVIMDAPLPGIGDWEAQLTNPLLWHFNFRGPDEERLVAGRERIYLDRFYDELSVTPSAIDSATRAHYAALYARPGGMHSAFAQFAAFSQDAADNRAFIQNGPLTMPILAIGAEGSYGTRMAAMMRLVATNVTPAVIAHSGHWMMEEQPEATVNAIVPFLEAPVTNAYYLAELRLSRSDIDELPRTGAGAGTSHVAGIETVVLSGDPSAAGPYAIEIRIPPNTHIAPHTHRDNRYGVVLSGAWHFAYGPNGADAKTLGPGGLYTEPGGDPHAAFTGPEGADIYLTGIGPTDTVYVNAADAPATH